MGSNEGGSDDVEGAGGEGSRACTGSDDLAGSGGWDDSVGLSARAASSASITACALT